MMTTQPFVIEEAGAEVLPRYVTVPIRFEVRSIYQLEWIGAGLGGVRLRHAPVPVPYVKDYDANESPLEWARQFDLRNWRFFLAVQDGRCIGGATVAFRTPGVNMLAGRDDLAVLWDIRVHPDARGRGVGSQLLRRAATWARARGCIQLKIETQNVNVPACRFYVSQGCELGEIDRYAYAAHPDVAHEAMLIWYLDLRQPIVTMNSEGEVSAG
jgi:GNAT superfamily N-acetyltransferase